MGNALELILAKKKKEGQIDANVCQIERLMCTNIVSIVNLTIWTIAIFIPRYKYPYCNFFL